ncbi:MAG: hypothetical protein AAFY64_09860, partial [Pseudomonadota bacterium]
MKPINRTVRAVLTTTSVLIAGCGFTVGDAAQHRAMADAAWSNGSPVFRSDVERRAARRQAERAKRRKSYGTTRYPKFMSGGGKPKIEAEAPQIVYLQRDIPAGRVIIDTSGRRLFFTLPDRKAYQYPIS